ncbi:hypothetical protein [Thalassorhabdomicrobium marinisediminis]|nr:hypothetical protein [Thalassorhabdomicrobium marinisediminis]
MAERHEDIAQVLPAPSGGPSRNGTLADGFASASLIVMIVPSINWV